MSTLNIKNLNYIENDVGKHIKSSKKHFVWEFNLDEKYHKIELYDSRYSGKKKLIKDGQIWKEVMEDVAFSKSFEIGNHSCTVIQHGEKYELRIDNQVFSHLMNLEKNKKFFNKNNPTSNPGIGKIEVIKNDKSDLPNLFSFKIKPNAKEQKNFSELNNQFKSKNNDTKPNTKVDNVSLLDFGGNDVKKVETSNTLVNNNPKTDLMDIFSSSNNVNLLETKNIQNNLFDANNFSVNKNISNNSVNFNNTFQYQQNNQFMNNQMDMFNMDTNSYPTFEKISINKVNNQVNNNDPFANLFG